MSQISLAEKILQIEARFSGLPIPHAFGGAIALAYYATPRATIDIDVNVFVKVDRSEEVLTILHSLGSDTITSTERKQLEEKGQARVFWDNTPVDLFFSYDPFHESCLERRRVFSFGEDKSIHVLSAEDLIIFKGIFNRSKDWRDINEMLFTLGDEIDTPYTLHWMGHIIGQNDDRWTRLQDALAPPQ